MHVSGQVPVSGSGETGQPQAANLTYAEPSLAETLSPPSTTTPIKPAPGAPSLSGAINKVVGDNKEALEDFKKMTDLAHEEGFCVINQQLQEGKYL
jgi:hypothetical protein